MNFQIHQIVKSIQTMINYFINSLFHTLYLYGHICILQFCVKDRQQIPSQYTLGTVIHL